MGENTKINVLNAPPKTSRGLLPYVLDLIMMIRVAHWAKNLFLYIPIFFAGDIFDPNRDINVTIGVIAFSLIASAIYILNDIKDINYDRCHPVKRYRALASGRVPITTAVVIMGLFAIASLLLAWHCGYKFFCIICIYLILNVGYSFGLKNISILDILILSTGFVLRIKGGAVLGQVGISQWLIIMVFLLSLFLALAKRKDDIQLKPIEQISTRQSVDGYNTQFLNISLTVVSAIMIMAYLMYTLSSEVILRMGTYRLYYTTVFVFAGLLRYLQFIYIQNETRSPIRILYKDHFIQICIALWLLSFYFLLYFKNFHL